MQVAQGQKPFAAILTCADSRVPPEIMFDQGFGDLFVVRIAGNTAADPIVVGSLEYGVEVLGCVLVFVLGHSDCGAVKSAIDRRRPRVPMLPGDIGAVVAPILPAVEAVEGTPKPKLLEAATDENIHDTVGRAHGRPAARRAHRGGDISPSRVASTSSRVEWSTSSTDRCQTRSSSSMRIALPRRILYAVLVVDALRASSRSTPWSSATSCRCAGSRSRSRCCPHRPRRATSRRAGPR